MNAKTHGPLNVRREGPDGVKIAYPQDVTDTDTDFGIELVIGDW